MYLLKLDFGYSEIEIRGLFDCEKKAKDALNKAKSTSGYPDEFWKIVEIGLNTAKLGDCDSNFFEWDEAEGGLSLSSAS